MTPRLHNCNNTRRMGRAALGLLRPLRGSGFALGQPDRFATGESRRGRTGWGEASRRAAAARPEGSPHPIDNPLTLQQPI